jgi:hypothetical protein
LYAETRVSEEPTASSFSVEEKAMKGKTVRMQGQGTENTGDRIKRHMRRMKENT